ncbi:hypothetical protein BDV35DRAFT_364888 [Aspergillus flavus]|uniref:Uncharacterized protein n=1 Tax=Aspergillus flavus TaxID=5059 RepID=A0A5N6GM02_ASPFL|nr:hypothetical protein BDV35DRAFT_364888 [Aspergillus flavus]
MSRSLLTSTGLVLQGAPDLRCDDLIAGSRACLWVLETVSGYGVHSSARHPCSLDGSTANTPHPRLHSSPG